MADLNSKETTLRVLALCILQPYVVIDNSQQAAPRGINTRTMAAHCKHHKTPRLITLYIANIDFMTSLNCYLMFGLLRVIVRSILDALVVWTRCGNVV